MLRFLYITIFSLVLLSCNSKEVQTPINIELHNNWEFKQVDSTQWHTATVPGEVHSDLLNHKLIEDPFIGNNEHDLQWISETNWEYKTQFLLDNNILNKKHIDLNFEGLDTYAKVFLNDSLILNTNNAFLNWKKDVKSLLNPENTLKVIFTKPSEIEAKAGKALAEIPWVIKAITEKDLPRIIEGLKTIKEAWNEINPVFDRMPEQCDPYIYYHRVRPYIHGWKGNPALPDGLIYEGVDKYKGKPQPFRGQTGSQSSIVPTMDGFLGIAHENDPLKEYLDELHEYRPPAHRAFIEDVRSESQLRDFVTSAGNAELTGLYNDIVTAVEDFRTRHLEYAASYIHKQARDADGNPTDIGTGGTPFMKYLKKHRDESGKHLIK